MFIPTKISNLRVVNFKRISTLEIRPHDNAIILGGQNEQGKSSILDAIMAALGGPRYSPEMPVHAGQDKGHVELDLGDYTLRRTFKANGRDEVQLINKTTGAKEGSPQKIIDSWLGSVGFDPLQFASAKPVEQQATLKRLTGLDFFEADQKRQRLFDQRTNTNRDAKSARAQYEGMAHYPDMPASEVRMSEIADQINTGIQTNDRNRRARDKAASLFAEVEREQKKLEDLRRQLAEQETLVTAKLEEKKRAEAYLLTIKDVDLTELQREASQIDSTNAKVRANADRAAKLVEVERLEAQSNKLTNDIEELDNAKRERLASAKFPLAGLSFDMETGAVLYNAIPLAQASQAVQLKVSVAVGMALNPGLRVMLVRQGAFLDEKNLSMLVDLAHEHDFQIWIERVGTGPEVKIVIEDGSIAEVR